MDSPLGLFLPHPPIETPILNRFGEMLLTNILRSIKIGDGTRDLEDARVTAGGEAEALSDELEQAVAGFIRLAMFANEEMNRDPEQLADWLTGRYDPCRRNRNILSAIADNMLLEIDGES